MYRNLSIAIFSILIVFVVGFSQISKQSVLTGKTAEIRSAMERQVKRDTQPPIRFTVEIPTPPGTMPLYKLTATRAPVDFFNEKLEKAKLPTLRLDKRHYT